MKKSKYSEKLRDPRWQKKRLEIMERDKFTCQACASEVKTLNVHHIKYVYGKDPWNYDNESLVTLCEYCHEHEKEEFDEKIGFITEMFEDGLFFSGELSEFLDMAGTIINKYGKNKFLSILFHEATKK